MSSERSRERMKLLKIIREECGLIIYETIAYLNDHCEGRLGQMEDLHNIQKAVDELRAMHREDPSDNLPLSEPQR